MNNFFRFTLWEDAKAVADSLGLTTDGNSRPDLFEWYLTFDNEKDSVAFGSFLVDKDGLFIKHGFSFWNSDPRA